MRKGPIFLYWPELLNKTCIKLAINFHLCSESLMNVWWKFPVNLSGVQVWVKFSPNLHQTFTWRSGSSKNLSFFLKFDIKKVKKSWQAHRKLQNVRLETAKHWGKRHSSKHPWHDVKLLHANSKAQCLQQLCIKKATEVKIIFTKNFLRKSTQKNPKRNVLKNKLEEKSLPTKTRKISSVPRLFWKRNLHPTLSLDNTVDGQNPAPHLNERNPFPIIVSDTFRSFRLAQHFVHKKHLPKIYANKNLAKQIKRL